MLTVKQTDFSVLVTQSFMNFTYQLNHAHDVTKMRNTKNIYRKTYTIHTIQNSNLSLISLKMGTFLVVKPNL